MDLLNKSLFGGHILTTWSFYCCQLCYTPVRTLTTAIGDITGATSKEVGWFKISFCVLGIGIGHNT